MKSNQTFNGVDESDGKQYRERERKKNVLINFPIMTHSHEFLFFSLFIRFLRNYGKVILFFKQFLLTGSDIVFTTTTQKKLRDFSFHY